MKEKKIVLTIAGSDPCGGAGIQSDIRTASRIGLYPCSVITAITAQSTSEVKGVWNVGRIELEAQLDCLLQDISPDAVKIGIIPSTDILDIIVKAIQKYDLNNVVVDPILTPTLSNKEPDRELAEAYISNLFPLAALITPNIPEKDFFESIAEEPFENICNAFLLKGGHGESSICTDKLYYHSLQRMSADFQSTSFPTLNNRTQPFLPQDLSPLAEEEYLNSIVSKEFRHKRIFSTNTHGSGCILSTAIACYLAQEYYLEKAVEYGLKFTYNALKESTDFQLGKGTYGPALV